MLALPINVAWLSVACDVAARSEEHTSDSSHGYISYAGFCLEKKNRLESPSVGPAASQHRITPLMLPHTADDALAKPRPFSAPPTVLTAVCRRSALLSYSCVTR